MIFVITGSCEPSEFRSEFKQRLSSPTASALGGFMTSWGGGAFGFLHSLALNGPLTVPGIAQTRPTSRQRMQRLADELAEGLVKFVDNPKHRRSKLVQLTPKGSARYRALNANFLTIAATMGADIAEADIRKTTKILGQLSDELKARL